MRRRSAIYFITFLIALAVLAAGQQIAPQAAWQVIAAGTASAATPVATLTFGPGSFNLQPATGLADLSIYQASLKIGFQGNVGGQPNPWTATFELLSSGKPSARVLTATFKGKATASAYVAPWSVVMNGVFYRRAADGTCIGRVIEAQANPNIPLVWEPADFLPGVIGAEEAGAKKVNNVAAKGYKFDERALGAAGRAKATGEVWVADPGGFVVKYALTLTGGPEYFGEGGQGTLTWTYDLTRAGQPTTIALPKDCPEGMIDAPLMQDAENVQRLPGTTLYTTKSTLAQIAAFYQKQLPTTGWKLDGQPDIGKKAGLLNFKQGDSHLTLIIMVSKDKTLVRLVLETSRKG